MTTHWCDFQNTDVIMNIGSNSTENHPLSSRWLNKAHERGAKWLVVDPRYTRTAEMADIYCPIRSGTDIAFYGGLYKYIIDNLIEPGLADYLANGTMDKYNFSYLLNYTNASYLLKEGYDFDPETGLYSGFDEKKRKYDASTWHYQVESEEEWDTSENGDYAWVKKPGVPEFTTPTLEHPKRDMTLKDPMCVYQQLKKHYERYDMQTVCDICGMSMDQLKLTYETICESAAPGKSGVVLYALGQTQHTYGAQNVRAMAIMQLLLGNVGVPGGGVAALRGEPNVQGATDMGVMVAEHPAYLKWPNTTDRSSLRKWLESQTYSDGYYSNKPKFIVSSLKEFFGKNATVDNDYGYDWWPKVDDEARYTEINTFELMREGVIEGYFNFGMNPAHSAPNGINVRQCMANLKWLVTVDWKPTHSSTFWKAPDMNPADIQTEVYYLPAALIYEKMGIILTSGRWLQWRDKAVDPDGEAKPDYEILTLLWEEVVRLYKEEGGVCPEPILNTKWDYYVNGKPDPRPVAWAFNGYRTETSDFSKGKVDLLKGYSELAADGSTACPMWIYGGCWNNNDAPLDAHEQPLGRRDNEDNGLGLYSNWSFSWPSNRRILYNRCASDPQGKPWNPDKALNEWDGTKWKQLDVADFVVEKDGKPVPPNNKAFMMLWEQNSRLESYGMADGPMPEHYEPFESPVEKNKLNGSFNNPMIQYADLESNKKGDVSQYPIVATTYSVTEHWQSGVQSNMSPALVEAMPANFIEIPTELAAEKGIQKGDKVRVFNERGSVVVESYITDRLQPLQVDGKKQWLVGLIHHYGWTGKFGQGDNVNDLTPNVGDPNTYIPEYKAFLVNIEKA